MTSMALSERSRYSRVRASSGTSGVALCWGVAAVVVGVESGGDVEDEVSVCVVVVSVVRSTWRRAGVPVANVARPN